MAYHASGNTHIGLVRKENQDHFLLLPQQGFFALADGMGGHAGGRQASMVAIETMKALALEEETLSESAVNEAVDQANRNIREMARKSGMQGMGTTLTLLFPQEEVWKIGHIGDSRAYGVNAQVLQPLTHDHSLVSELVASGSITEEEAANHPQRNVLTRALGADSLAVLEWTSIPRDQFSYLLLCTDGLYNMVAPEKILEIVLHPNLDLDTKADQLIKAANAQGGTDNTTVILVKQEG